MSAREKFGENLNLIFHFKRAMTIQYYDLSKSGTIFSIFQLHMLDTHTTHVGSNQLLPVKLIVC